MKTIVIYDHGAIEDPEAVRAALSHHTCEDAIIQFSPGFRFEVIRHDGFERFQVLAERGAVEDLDILRAELAKDVSMIAVHPNLRFDISVVRHGKLVTLRAA